MGERVTFCHTHGMLGCRYGIERMEFFDATASLSLKEGTEIGSGHTTERRSDGDFDRAFNEGAGGWK